MEKHAAIHQLDTPCSRTPRKFGKEPLPVQVRKQHSAAHAEQMEKHAAIHQLGAPRQRKTNKCGKKAQPVPRGCEIVLQGATTTLTSVTQYAAQTLWLELE